MRRHVIFPALFTLISLAGASAPQAQVAPGTWEIELYAGTYIPDPDILDSDATWGFRAGLNMSKRFNLSGTVGFFSSDQDFTQGTVSGNADLEATFVDITATLNILPDKKANITAFGGIGWSFADFLVSSSMPGFAPQLEGIGEDSFTLHAGGGARIHLSSFIYLYPQLRLRYFTDRDSDELDEEVTLAIGFTIGR